MAKDLGDVALDDVLFTIEQRVSQKGNVYYVWVLHVNGEDVKVGFVSDEHLLTLFKMGVKVR